MQVTGRVVVLFTPVGRVAREKVPVSALVQLRHDPVGHQLAAAAKEREYTGQRRAQLLLQRLLDEAPRAVEARLDRLGTNAEEVRSLLDAHTLHDARHEHGA